MRHGSPPRKARATKSLSVRAPLRLSRETAASPLPTPLPVHDEAAIDVERLAAYVPGAWRSEEDGQGRHVFRLLPAAQRHHLFNFLGGPFLVVLPRAGGLLVGPGLPDGAIEFRFHHSGTQRIDAD